MLVLLLVYVLLLMLVLLLVCFLVLFLVRWMLLRLVIESVTGDVPELYGVCRPKVYVSHLLNDFQLG